MTYIIEGARADLTVILENANGVQLHQDTKAFGPHFTVRNALCECGEPLLVAPLIYGADHRKGDPVVVCADHGTHAYRFSELSSRRLN